MAPNAQDRYEELRQARDPFLRRARLCASLTIPSVMPPEGTTQFDQLPETYNGHAARCVTSLGSRLMTALLPPSVQHFKLSIPANVLREAGQLVEDKSIERNLAIEERTIAEEIERQKWRSPTYTALQHLIITGNALEQILPSNKLKVYRLDQYVIVRTPEGEVIEIVICENLAAASLPADIAKVADMVAAKAQGNLVPLYTHVTWSEKKGHWEIYQEVSGREVPGSRGTWEVSPFNVLRWSVVLGEDYGRSKVEEHIGDFVYLDEISKDVKDGSKMASRHVVAVRPASSAGLNIRRKLASSRNGDVIIADPDAIGMLQFANTTGLQVSAAQKAEVERALGEAFLLASSYRRDAERVTAYEVSKMIEEIEAVLGGVFSQLSQDMAEPRLRRLMFQMKRQGKLANWPEGVVEPTILTGLEALSRERDVERVQMIMNITGALTPEERIWIKMPTLLSKLLTGAGVPEAVRTDEEYGAELDRQTQAQAAARGQQQPME